MLFVLVGTAFPADWEITGNHRASEFVGYWTWNQWGANTNGFASLSIGELQVEKNGTFSIWNARKINNNDCYVIEEAEGKWEKESKGHYRAGYGESFFDVMIRNGTGTFTSMSVSTDYDIGWFEVGYIMKSAKKKFAMIKAWYESRICITPSPTIPIVPPEPIPPETPPPLPDYCNSPIGKGMPGCIE